MFKKILCAVMAVMMCFVFTSCSFNKANGNSVTCGDTSLVGVWVVEEMEETVTPEKKEDEEKTEDEDETDAENKVIEEIRIMEFLSNGICYSYFMTVYEDRTVLCNEDAGTWYAENGTVILDTERLNYKRSGRKLEIFGVEFEEDTEEGKTKVYEFKHTMVLKRSNKSPVELLEGVQKRANKDR